MKRTKLFLLLLIFILSSFLTGCSLLDIVDLAVNNAQKYLKEEHEYKYEYPDYDYDNLKTVGDLYVGSMPSTGNVNALVFPVDFFNESKPDYSKSDIELLLFSESKSNYNSIVSLRSFYKKSSYNKLDITGTVFDYYTCKYSSKDYEKKFNDYTSDVILEELISYYGSSIDFSKYDSNNDHYIDCVYMIYSKEYNSDSNIWWAYQTVYQDKDSKTNGLKVGDYTIARYVWLSEDFFKDNRTLSDTTTIIHETGHLMGLDDYYDYDPNNGGVGGLGGADMMDYNVGDHCSLSKILLGWIEPTVYDNKDSKIYTLNSFSQTGDVLLISHNEYTSIFSEYYLIEYYTPTNLNSTNPYLTRSGFRVLHVDATLGEGGLRGSYFTYFEHDNSDTEDLFIKMITPKGVFNQVYAQNSDLFQTLDEFNGANYMWNDKSPLNFKISFGFQLLNSKGSLQISPITNDGSFTENNLE